MIARALSTFVDPSARVHEHAVVVGDVTLEEGVSVGPGAVLDGGAEPVVVRRHASLGANVTVRSGVEIGRRAVVEPGTVVAQNVPANAIVTGNPATIVAYVDSGLEEPAPELVTSAELAEPVSPTRVPGVTLHRLTFAQDLRGSMAAAEFAELPFQPRRVFTVYDVPSESVRGAHAHRLCSQLLVCLAGSVSCLVDDGSTRDEVRLESPSVALHVPPMIWGTQWRYTREAVLLVLASHPYDAGDYIRDYEEFLAERERLKNRVGT
jgi:carbonic anhydrase/acetyltransferase-like protein (isoleucine patch superfamily)